MAANDALSLYQVGIQSAFGTNVAATAKLAVPRVDFLEAGVNYQPNVATGLLVANKGFVLPVKRGTTVRIPSFPFYYEQGQVWLNSLIKGGVTGAGGGAPFTWTFTRSLTADPALAYLTVERRVKDFSTSEDVEVGDVVFNQMQISYSEAEPLMCALEGFGRMNDDTSTLTSAQSLPTPEFAPSVLSKVYINDAYASIGNTQITGQIVGWEWTFNNGAMPKWSADGRANLDYTTLIHNGREVKMGLKLTCLMDPTQYATEKAKARAGAAGVRAIRISVAGSSSRSLTIDGLYTYVQPDILEFGEEEGQVRVVLDLEGFTDQTNFLSVVLINATDAPDGV